MWTQTTPADKVGAVPPCRVTRGRSPPNRVGGSLIHHRLVWNRQVGDPRLAQDRCFVESRAAETADLGTIELADRPQFTHDHLAGRRIKMQSDDVAEMNFANLLVDVGKTDLVGFLAHLTIPAPLCQEL